jgi:type IX secretion system PorP/SprF family membrane protein
MDKHQMKINIKILILVIATLPLVSVKAQQEQHYAQNMFNQLSYNPAFAGSVGAICATGIVRQQWVGFDGAPQTYSINISSPLNMLHGGVGLSIYQDQLGPQKEIGVKLMYAYRVDIGMGNLGIGATVGFINGSIDFGQFAGKIRDLEDELLQSTGNESDMLLDFGFGLHYFVPEKFYVALSSTRLSEQNSEILSYKTKRHYYFNAGYEFAFPNNSAFVLEPSILIKSDLVKTQYDIATLLKYNNKFWGGVSYSALRVMDPISAIIGLQIKDLKIGYAYTIPTSEIGSSGSHEVMIGYCFKLNFDKGRRSYKNTRFL